MSLAFNAFTGNLDEVEIPETVSTSEPTLAEDGQVQLAYINGQARIYFRTNGVTYYLVGIAG